MIILVFLDAQSSLPSGPGLGPSQTDRRVYGHPCADLAPRGPALWDCSPQEEGTQASSAPVRGLPGGSSTHSESCPAKRGGRGW